MNKKLISIWFGALSFVVISNLQAAHDVKMAFVAKQIQRELKAAIRENDLNRVMEALDKGAEINQSDSDGDTPLHLAAEKGRQEIIEVFLNRGADINACGYRLFTPLHDAVLSKQREAVRFLLEHGAALEARTLNGNTPLHIAACGDLEIAELLLSRGANRAAQNKFGMTALQRVQSPMAGAPNYAMIKLLSDAVAAHIQNHA